MTFHKLKELILFIQKKKETSEKEAEGTILITSEWRRGEIDRKTMKWRSESDRAAEQDDSRRNVLC